MLKSTLVNNLNFTKGNKVTEDYPEAILFHFDLFVGGGKFLLIFCSLNDLKFTLYLLLCDKYIDILVLLIYLYHF